MTNLLLSSCFCHCICVRFRAKKWPIGFIRKLVGCPSAVLVGKVSFPKAWSRTAEGVPHSTIFLLRFDPSTHDDVKRVALVINFNQVQDVKRQFSIERKSGHFNRTEFGTSFISIELGAVECTLSATAKD